MRRRRSEFGWEERERKGEREDKDRIWSVGGSDSLNHHLAAILRSIRESSDRREFRLPVVVPTDRGMHAHAHSWLSLKAATARTHFLPLASAHCNSLIRRSLSLSPLCCASPTHILCSPSEVGKNQLQNVICLCRYFNELIAQKQRSNFPVSQIYIARNARFYKVFPTYVSGQSPVRVRPLKIPIYISCGLSHKIRIPAIRIRECRFINNI